MPASPLRLHDHALATDASAITGVPQATLLRWIRAGLVDSIDWHSQRVIRLSQVREVQANPPSRGRRRAGQ